MPQLKVKHSIHIDRPPQEVFAYLADPDKMPEWQSSSFKVGDKKQATGQGKLQRGTQVEDRRNVLGKDIDAVWEVAEYEQDRHLLLRLIQGPISWQMDFTLEPLEGGTLLTADGGGDFGDMDMSAVAANRSGQDMLENDLKTLARVLEHGKGQGKAGAKP